MLKNFIMGLQILQRYYDDDDPLADSDRGVFSVRKTDHTLTFEDWQRLVELDWFQYSTPNDGCWAFEIENNKVSHG